MSRQFPRAAAVSGSGRCGPDALDRKGVGRAGAAALAATLLLGWNSTVASNCAGAQQSPDTWTAERRATLPSGLTAELEFSPVPGVSATAAPGKLAIRTATGTGGGTDSGVTQHAGNRNGGKASAYEPPAPGSPASGPVTSGLSGAAASGTSASGPAGSAAGASGYADGLRPGDPAETFRIAEERPQADGSWRTLGTLQLSFSRAVRNPRLHLSGLAGLATGKGGSTSTATRLTVTGGSPSAPSLVGRTGWPGWTVSGNTLAPAGDGQADGATDGLGTLELAGTVTTVTFRVEERSTARAGSTTAPAALKHAYTVTLDEGLGTAPQGYGNASHLVSDLFLGQDTTGNPGRTPAEPIARNGQPLVSREPGSGAATLRDPRELDDVPSPLIDPDRGASRRSPFASPLPARNQPGRAEYQGADPTVTFPGEVAIGRYYELTVPVNPGSGPATLVGWIDFDHNGHFDATERVQAEVPAASTSARLEWTVPGNAASGETWARLRIARDPSQLVGPGGFADSGQVLDQRVKLTVGAARPEITGPVAGTVVAEARPEIRGYGAVAGAAVAVVEGDATLCRAKAGSDGAWTCRPERPLAPGEHRLVPVETTQGGVVLHGEPVKLTVKTAPPAAPALALPEFTNDPGLLFTGTADPGTTVSVTEASASPGAPRTGELCSTAVAADRTWSCLPVESLADGQHQVVATAVDAAGNRTPGRPVTLVVDTAAPERPTLASPASGALLTTARPRLTGRAEAAATVTVTARLGEDGDRFLLCSAQTAADGTWGCTATRDVAEGEFTVVVTATDRAGNGATGEPVTVKVRPPAAPVTPSAPATPSAPVSPTPAAPPPSAQSPGATAVQSAAPSATADATKDAAPAPTAVPAGLVGSASPAPARSAAPSAAVPTASGPAPVSNQLPAPTPTAGRPGAAAGTASAGSPGAPKGGAASSARALAALPESPEAVAARRTATGGWRSALCGGLFFLAGVGLLARRLVGRGPGLRRR